MKPDQPTNYWQPEPPEEKPEEQTPEMYTPEPIAEAATPAPTPEAQPMSQVGPEAEQPQPVEASQQTIEEEPVRWEANEYIHPEKTWLWFLVFGLVAVGLIVVDLLFLKSYTFSFLVIVMAIAVIVYSRRPPRAIQYTLSGNQGLYIGERLYHYSDFKSFGLIRDGEHHSIMLIPTKRFSPGVSVYFPEEAGEKIVDILGARLPMETLKLDVIDIVVRKLRL